MSHQNFQLRIKIVEAFGLARHDRTPTNTPLVVAKFRGRPLNKVQTSTSTTAMWNQELMLYPKTVSDVLILKVYDRDSFKNSNFMGLVELPLEKFFQTGMNDIWLQLMAKQGGKLKRLFTRNTKYMAAPGQLHIQIWFGVMSPTLEPIGAVQSNYVTQQQAPAVIDNTTASFQPITRTPSYTLPVERTITETIIMPPNTSNAPVMVSRPSTSQLFDTGYNPVNPADFQWYQRGLASPPSVSVPVTTVN